MHMHYGTYSDSPIHVLADTPCKDELPLESYYGTGEVLSKNTWKRGSSRFWSGLMVFWLFQTQISALNRGRSIKNWQTGVPSLFLREVAT